MTSDIFRFKPNKSSSSHSSYSREDIRNCLAARRRRFLVVLVLLSIQNIWGEATSPRSTYMQSSMGRNWGEIPSLMEQIPCWPIFSYGCACSRMLEYLRSFDHEKEAEDSHCE